MGPSVRQETKMIVEYQIPWIMIIWSEMRGPANAKIKMRP